MKLYLKASISCNTSQGVCCHLHAGIEDVLIMKSNIERFALSESEFRTDIMLIFTYLVILLSNIGHNVLELVKSDRKEK